MESLTYLNYQAELSRQIVRMVGMGARHPLVLMRVDTVAMAVLAQSVVLKMKLVPEGVAVEPDLDLQIADKRREGGGMMTR